MPDATITSTASTFGTISGTFAADQSTVTGTITGTVTGTLTGSVGVPGPQGPTGATGATGATGPAGSPGAPGQGVPVGGTAGQFLSKIDSTNYNTDWTTVNLSVYAVKANNLSDLADAPTARTNLGLGTMATATAADYSTTAQAAALYYPLTGNPSGFLTSVPPPTLTNLTSDISWDGSANTGRLLIAGVNDIGGGQTEARLNFVSGVPTQPATGDFWTNGTDFFYRESGSTKTIASQSYVSATYQTLAGMSSYLTTASAAATYFTIASAANKADLASPTFTGTPTLPTGTIATTQSPGNNTTALATTAFVTAAVPAFATNAEAIVGTSSTKVLSPSLIPALITRPELRSFAHITQTAVQGSGAVTTGAVAFGQREMYLASLATGRAAFSYSIPGNNSVNMSRTVNGQINFSKKIWLAGKCMCGVTLGATNYNGDTNTFTRITLGGYNSLTTGDMTLKGIGWKKQGGTSPYFNLTVHNGTTRTDVATTVQQSDGRTIDWQIYSDGAGNVTLYIDGAEAATTTAGPTGMGTTSAAAYREQVEAATTPAVRGIIESTGGWLYIEG